MGFFESIFGNKKTFDFECPMCSREYSAKLNPDDVKEEREVLEETACEFCKTDMEVVYFKDETDDRLKVIAYDVKWEAIEKEHDDKYGALEDEISELEGTLEELLEGDLDEDELKKDEDDKRLKKKIAQLQKKADKLEKAFETKEDRYTDRQERWQEKWEEKLERMKR